MNTKIRELKFSDRIVLSNLLSKLSDKVKDDSLLNLIKSSSNKKQSIETDKDDMKMVKLGIELFQLLIKFLEVDLNKWFADLCNITYDEYLKQAPFDIEIIIVNQLFDDQGKIKSFLSGASMLFKKIKISLSNTLETKE